MDSPLNVARKRLLSLGDESASAGRKRPRVSVGVSPSYPSDSPATGHPRPLSSASSFTSTSRPCSPRLDDTRSSMGLIPSVSSPPPAPTYPECSAKHHIRNTKISWDFSSPGAVMTCSGDNVVFFSRGDRVHYKNIATGEEVGQLLRLREGDGDLRVLKCAPAGDMLAVGTSTGLVQLWDIKARKKVASWTNKKTVSAMAWNANGDVLSIGAEKGTIRHYDTRIGIDMKNVGGMKEQARKVTRHQGCITALEWNVDGRIWASGDSSGIVYCWDGNGKERVPLDVGEFVQRRKKMQHGSAISALAFCPWQPRLLATGDVNGIMQLWNVNPLVQHSNSTTPGKLELSAPITSIYFSPHCKEILTTHSCNTPSPCSSSTTTRTRTRARADTLTNTNTPPTLVLPWPRQTPTNAIAIHAYPSLRHVTTLVPSLSLHPQTGVETSQDTDQRQGLVGSVLNAAGTRVVVANGEGKMGVVDVWAKRREVKRVPSFLGAMIR